MMANRLLSDVQMYLIYNDAHLFKTDIGQGLNSRISHVSGFPYLNGSRNARSFIDHLYLLKVQMQCTLYKKEYLLVTLWVLNQHTFDSMDVYKIFR